MVALVRDKDSIVRKAWMSYPQSPRKRATASPSRRQQQQHDTEIVQMPTGLDALRRPELQALAKSLKVNATLSNEELIKLCKQALPNLEQSLATNERECVRAAFIFIDANHDGTLSATEITKALRNHPSVRRLLSLPAIMRKEAEIHESIERVCEALDDEKVTMEEFEDAFHLVSKPESARKRGFRPCLAFAVAVLLLILACVMLAVLVEIDSVDKLTLALNETWHEINSVDKLKHAIGLPQRKVTGVLSEPVAAISHPSITHHDPAFSERVQKCVKACKTMFKIHRTHV